MAFLSNALRFRLYPHMCRTIVRNCSSNIQNQEPKTVQSGGEKCLNKLTLIGRIGNDPEVRGTSERPLTLFSVATSFTFRTEEDDTYKQITDWHRVVVFKPGLQKYTATALSKGDRVYVSGQIRYNKFLDKDTNLTVRTVSVNADEVMLLTKKRQKTTEQEDNSQDEIKMEQERI